MTLSDDLGRIEFALQQAAGILESYTPGRVDYRAKDGGSPVTEADLAVDARLREILQRDGDGWLSEETADDGERLSRRRVWIVDPLDGTQEFVDGVPEWCVSIGLVEDGRPVAGGIHAPPSGQTLIGSVANGATLNDERCRTSRRDRLDGALILASRSETRRGEWERFRDAPFVSKPTGSVAFKLAQVAAGLADGTWTQTPKNEWDVAAGVALVLAGGGRVWLPDGSKPGFNRQEPLFDGLFACGPGIADQVTEHLARHPGKP
jgi:myo-inositol-1(or 4)-monophosphatase